MAQLRKVSIFFLSIGSGHQIAAEALGEALRRASPLVEVRVTDPFRESIEILPSILETLQAASLKITPSLYDSMWRRGASDNLYDWLTELSPLKELLVNELETHPADIIVSTHVLPCVMSLGLKNRFSQIQKVFGIITDFGAHMYWPEERINGYFVAHEELRQTLIFRGVQPDRIYVTGIPIRLGFENVPSPEKVVLSEKLRVLITAGGLRSSAYANLKKYFTQLVDAMNSMPNASLLSVTIVTGSQTRLEKELKGYEGNVHFPLQILGYVQDMHRLMAEHDILVAKAGGLMVSEALASGICLVVPRPNPGQENANVEFLARHGVAFRGENSTEVVKVFQRCLANPALVAEMRERSARLGFPRAATSITNHLLRAMSPSGFLFQPDLNNSQPAGRYPGGNE